MSDIQSNNKRIAKNTIFLYGRLIFTMLIALYTTRVVLQTLGVVDYGIYNVVCGFVAMFSFLNTSLSNGIQRFYNYEAGKNGEEAMIEVYRTAIIIQILLAAIIFITLETFGLWYINNKMVIPADRLMAANWIFQFSLLSLVFLILQVPFSAAIMAHEKMDYYAGVGIIDAVLKLAIILILPWLSGDHLIIYGILVLSVSLLNFFMYSIYTKSNFKELTFKFSFNKSLFSSIYKFTGWNLIEMFAWTTQTQGVNMIMNLFCGPIVNAAQGVASQVSSAISAFCSNLSVAFRPQLIHSYAEGIYERTRTMLFTMSKSMFAMMTMMIIPLIIEMHYILHIWIGDNIPDYTFEFTILVILSMLPRNMTMALSQVIHASGKMKNYQLGSALVILLSLPTSYILLKNGFSPVSIYIANISIFILLWAVDIYLLRKVFVFSLKKYILDVVIPCLSLLALSPVIPYVISSHMNEGAFRLIVTLVTSVLFTGILAYCLLLKKEEKKSIKSIIKRKLM